MAELIFPFSVLLDFRAASLINRDNNRRYAEFTYALNPPITLNPRSKYEAEIISLYFPFASGYVSSVGVSGGRGGVVGVLGSDGAGVRLPLRPGLGSLHSLSLTLHWWPGTSKAPPERISSTQLLLVIYES